MKKLIVLISVSLLCFTLSASENWFDFSVGAGISYKDNLINAVQNMEEFNKDDLSFGVEARTKVLFTEVDLAGSLFITTHGELGFDGILAAGFTDDLFSFARFALCAGPSFNYRNDGKKGTLIVENLEIDNISLGYVFYNSPFTFRATLDFILGPVLKIGVAYNLPTEYTLSSGNLNQLVPNSNNWRDGQLSLSILLTLI